MVLPLFVKLSPSLISVRKLYSLTNSSYLCSKLHRFDLRAISHTALKGTQSHLPLGFLINARTTQTASSGPFSPSLHCLPPHQHLIQTSLPTFFCSLGSWLHFPLPFLSSIPSNLSRDFPLTKIFLSLGENLALPLKIIYFEVCKSAYTVLNRSTCR